MSGDEDEHYYTIEDAWDRVAIGILGSWWVCAGALISALILALLLAVSLPYFPDTIIFPLFIAIILLAVNAVCARSDERSFGEYLRGNPHDDPLNKKKEW